MCYIKSYDQPITMDNTAVAKDEQAVYLFTTQSYRTRKDTLTFSKFLKKTDLKMPHVRKQIGKLFPKMFLVNMRICAILRNKRRNNSALRSLFSL